MTTYAFVPSPLTGAAVWAGVVDALLVRGERAVLVAADQPADADGPSWSAMVDAARDVTTADDRLALVVHSGAGPRAAALVDGLRAAGRTVEAVLFVDAGLPGAAALPADLRAQVDSLAVDGVAPPWPDWWPPGTVEALVPDPIGRAAVVEGCRPVPLAYLDEQPPVPLGWDAGVDLSYLSFTYEVEALAAQRRGWVVGRADGSHLQMVVDPAGVAELVLILLAGRTGAP